MAAHELHRAGRPAHTRCTGYKGSRPILDSGRTRARGRNATRRFRIYHGSFRNTRRFAQSNRPISTRVVPTFHCATERRVVKSFAINRRSSCVSLSAAPLTSGKARSADRTNRRARWRSMGQIARSRIRTLASRESGPRRARFQAGFPCCFSGLCA